VAVVEVVLARAFLEVLVVEELELVVTAEAVEELTV
jgi:hypothetical protein